MIPARRGVRPLAAAALGTLLTLAACGGGAAAPAPTPSPAAAAPSAPAPPGDPGLARRLAEQVTGDAAFARLEEFQRIADANGGNRASGQPGYDASVEYVAGELRRAGFTVETPSFPFDTFAVDTEALAVAGAPGPAVTALIYSPATPAGGVTAPLVVAPDAPGDPTPGCEATDYANLPARGAVVLVRRGSCTFTQKQQVAAEAGAAAVLVGNNAPGPLGGTLGSVAEGRLPTGGLLQSDFDALLARAGTPVTLTLATRSATVTTRNVIAQTTTGRTDEVVMSGAHLDSVAEGPGINDNGSGSAAQLELAVRLGGAPPVTNAVRFAWWGAEEVGLLGSTAYVQGLTPEARRDIALLINSDMLGSPNPAYLVYDGDDSDREGAPPGPAGSGGIERTLAGALTATGVPPRGTDFDGRSDYGPFIEAGIPAGGLFTGAEEVKTPEQAAVWGGQAGVPYDRCYHQACDTTANIDRVALDRMLDALAVTVGTYAVDLGGPNGVPAREQRQTR
ncbi:M28 family metallopeptidase [Actinomycetospora cinnamomea]|uniref:Zn-dependent M28 family amino/carboxypeptidase n=1 Tax=Actinomycetospora cinnamomea TaxID=663609 RepID=A0A2U1FQ97_9PSEU|nr:M28 family metallopeptidase [Actinomycetospora cinnamomea]PVZ14365.1 Zn-dependent M28 family amino/carboxypeptidase [Actinomycetospora cinnamomea]